MADQLVNPVPPPAEGLLENRQDKRDSASFVADLNGDNRADIVVAGRLADAALVTGPAAWHFGWRRNDWDRLAGAAVAGGIGIITIGAALGAENIEELFLGGLLQDGADRVISGITTVEEVYRVAQS